jgi:hypothetical protein
VRLPAIEEVVGAAVGSAVGGGAAVRRVDGSAASTVSGGWG